MFKALHVEYLIKIPRKLGIIIFILRLDRRLKLREMCTLFQAEKSVHGRGEIQAKVFVVHNSGSHPIPYTWGQLLSYYYFKTIQLS